MRFNVIVADPPWEFEDRYGKRGADKKYDVMPFEELKALRVNLLASDNSLLALWVPWALLPRGLVLMHAWEFVYKTAWVWGKLTKRPPRRFAMGTGRIFRAATEVCLIGKRGSPIIRVHDRLNISLSKRLAHSSKPGKLQDDLQAMVRGPRLELFARRKRKGWRCVGLECNGEDVRKSIRRLTKL